MSRCALLAVLVVLWGPAQARELFDYYVLSLSWSPSWCASKAGRGDDQQCGVSRGYGFVVHGLWPQYAGGGYPSQCAGAEPVLGRLVESLLPIMPSRQLIQHQWDKHGSCAGQSQADYFAKLRTAFDHVRIPKPFQDPAVPQYMAVSQVEALFQSANPGLAPDGISVICRGHHAAEIRVCLDKDLNFRPCARDVRDRCKGEALFPAAR